MLHNWVSHYKDAVSVDEESWSYFTKASSEAAIIDLSARHNPQEEKVAIDLWHGISVFFSEEFLAKNVTNLPTYSRISINGK